MGDHLTHHSGNSHDLSSEKALEADYVERTPTGTQAAPPTAKRGFGSKLKRHCVRFWWIHVIVFCICFLIIALCLVYVGLPRIAQQDVDGTSLELTELSFLDPKPDELTLTQAAILHNPHVFTPSLDSFFADTYYVDNTTGFGPEPMIKLEMPKIHALHPESTATVAAQAVKILNLAEVTRYVVAVLTREYVSTALVGSTLLHLGKLPNTKINYNTTLTYKGLNGLAGFNVTDARVNTSVPTGTPNLKGIAFIPNPSVITVAMGNVTLELSTEAQGVVGNATILDLTLRPGDNRFPLTAVVDQVKTITSMDAATGIVKMIITGRQSVYNGQHLTYYEEALADNPLHLDMNLKQILADSAHA